MSADNHPIPQTMEDLMAAINRQVSQALQSGAATLSDGSIDMGPGISARAVRLIDWSVEEATFNGYFYSLPGAHNTPDDAFAWTGQVIARDDGNGIQQVWNPDAPTEMTYWIRTYSVSPTTGALDFEDWKHFASADGFIPVDLIDPTVPISDGTPPTTAPTAVAIYPTPGGVGLAWDRVDNRDVTTYHVNVNVGADPVLDGTMEVAAGASMTSAFVSALADNTLLNDPSMDIRVVITVSDDDSDPDPTTWPASPVATGTTRPVSELEIDADAVYTRIISAMEGFIAVLSGVDWRAVTMTAPTIQTDDADNTGIKLAYDEDGNPTLKAWRSVDNKLFFEVNPNLGFVITMGQGTFTKLASLEEAEWAGLVELAAGATFTMVSGTTPPKVSPTASVGYDSIQFDSDGNWPNRRGLAWDGTSYYTYNKATRRIEKWNPTTGLRTAQSGTIIGFQLLGTPTYGNASMAWDSASSRLVFGLEVHYDAAPSHGGMIPAHDEFEIQTFTSALAGDTAVTWAHYSGTGDCPGIGYDPGHAKPLVIAQSQSSDTMRVRRYADLSFASPTVNDHGSLALNLTGVLADPTFDFGAGPPRLFVTGIGSSVAYCLDETAVNFRAADHFSLSITDKAGIVWDDTAGVFRSLDNAGRLRTYTGYAKSTAIGDASLTKWIAPEFYRSSIPAASGIGPKYKLNTIKRSKTTANGPDLKDSPGALDPDALRWYVGSGATEPTDPNMHKQTDPAAGAESVTYTDFTTGGGNPGSNTFPSSGASEIVSDIEDSDGPIINVKSDGTDGRIRDLRHTPHMFLGQRTTLVQTLTHNTVTLVGWNINEEYGLDIAANIITIAKAGLYRVHLSIGWTANTTGRRDVIIRKNGSNYAANSLPGSTLNAADATQVVSRHVPLAVGDTLAFYAFQASGANLDILGDPTRTYVDVVYAGDEPL